MAAISNKDLEQFGGVINTLINQIKKQDESIKESNSKNIDTTIKYYHVMQKNQNQFIEGFEYLRKVVEKTQIPPPSVSIDFKKDFELKVTNVLEEMKESVLKQNKKTPFQKYFIMSLTLITIITISLLLYRIGSNTKQTKIDAIKYRLKIKLARGVSKKNHLSWDSTANMFSLSELEEKLFKTEGK